MAPIWRPEPSTRGCRMKLHLQGLLPAGRVVRPHRSFRQGIKYLTTILRICQKNEAACSGEGCFRFWEKGREGDLENYL